MVFPQNALNKGNINDFNTNTNFNSLTYTGGDYSTHGEQIFLANGINVNVPDASGAGPSFDSNIILGANQTFTKERTGFCH